MKPHHVPGCCKGTGKPHTPCNEEMCSHCVTCIEHQIFCAAAARRKANGIRLGRLSMMVEPTQIEGFTILFEPWVKRYGKIGAVDAVISAMAESEARYQDAKRLLAEIKKREKEGRRARHA